MSIKRTSFFSLKRLFDFFAALILLLLLLPLMAIIALLICISSKGPILYFQKRIGFRGKEFTIFKFRTMVLNADQLIVSFNTEQLDEFHSSFKLKDDPRITQVGKFLRKTSLDELPQLINVLKGDMSLIGPRPVTKVELTEKFGDASNLVTSIRPGITGLWQVNGRNDISYEERIKLDVEYVINCCISTDIKILLKTLKTIFLRMGAY